MWLNKQVSFYKNNQDKTGMAATFRQILNYKKTRPIIDEIRILQDDYALGLFDDADYRKEKIKLKNRLPCFTPSALFGSRAKENIIEIDRTGLMQLDFDYADIQYYDISELKQYIFSLLFIAFCSLSCSGKGFYALALISEPNKLTEYAEHCFKVLAEYGIKADTSKGRNVNDLRYLSFDENRLINENPEPLHIRHFRAVPDIKSFYSSIGQPNNFKSSQALINRQLDNLKYVQVGNRFPTVQRVAYTLGGLNNASLLEDIIQAINGNEVFSGEEKKYIKCAKACFKEGSLKPLQNAAIEDFHDVLI